jgi:hypothetical protein
MSGDGKRSVAEWPKLPRPSSTLPNGWPVLVTVLGWLFVLGGLARRLFPTGLAAIAAGIGQITGAIMAGAIVPLLGLGAFLSFEAYRRD